jgi:hypothetical protein
MRGVTSRGRPFVYSYATFFFFFEGLWLVKLSAELNHVRPGAKTLLNYVLSLIRRPMQF